MDPVLTTLAVLAAQEVVKAMAGDGWHAVRDRVAQLIGRGDPQRAERQTTQLDRSRDELRAGRLAPEAAAERWQGRFEDLLDEYPELADELQKLVAARDGASGSAVTADGHGVAAGRDMVMHVSGGSAASLRMGDVTLGAPSPTGPSTPGRPQG
jgi:hypothetical protein